MLDIHIGVQDTNVAKTALDSIPTASWIRIHKITDAEDVYTLRHKGYTSGTNEWVTFIDQDDRYLTPFISNLDLQAITSQAFFTNSMVVTATDKTARLPSTFKWAGVRSIARGDVPHQPVFMKREVALAALQQAYDRILSADRKFLACTDLAVAMEVELAVGWKYDPRVLYEWYNDNPASHHCTSLQKAAYVEVYRYYQHILENK